MHEKPKIFKETIYRVPTKNELIDVDMYNLSTEEILNGFKYTIVGRGVMWQAQKDKIIESIQSLCKLFPHNIYYKEALKKAQNLELFKSKKAYLKQRPQKIVSSFLKLSREFSCVMAPFPWDIAEEIRQWGLLNIPEEDLINDGREPDIHVTVLYGVHNHDPFEVRPLLDKIGPIKIILGEITIFENKDQDVVKISVESPDLVRLNKLISGAFEHTQTHPQYIPHCTLAYVKPGAGKKYVGRKDFAGKKITIDEILFSGNDYRETTFSL